MKTRLLVVAALALTAGGVVAFMLLQGSGSSEKEPGVERHRPSRVLADASVKGRPSRVKASTQGKKEKPSLELNDDDEDAKRTPEEKQLAADIERALDAEDFELAKKVAPIAVKSRDVQIRQAMVDTLEWFDAKALPELTPFLADQDEDVAESAMNAWEMAVSTIEDEAEKIGTVELAMQVISNEDALESISGEYIGVDEKLAVESLVRIIEAGGSAEGVAKAKETYEFVTGDEFVNRAGAEKWLAEEYQPSESE